MTFKTRYLLCKMLCLFAMIATLITCVDMVAMNRHFYSFQYDTLHIADSIGMKESDLYEASNTLLDYLKDNREDITVYANIHGEEREVYTFQEELHMVDVKNLYLNALFVRNICSVFTVFLLIILIYDSKREFLSLFTYTYKRFFIWFALLVGGLITYAACDFSTFWLYFHYVFFRNDLWLLDPSKSIMIQMFPQEFFFAMVFMIVLLFVSITVGLWLYSVYDQRKRMQCEIAEKGN